MSTQYIAPEVYNKAVAMRCEAESLKRKLRGRGTLEQKLAIKRQITAIENERRSMLLVEYASGNITL